MNIYQHPNTGALWTPLLETTPCALQARSEKNVKHHGAWSWNTTCTLRDTQKSEICILSCVSMRVIHVSVFSTPCKCVGERVSIRHPFWCVSGKGCLLGAPFKRCRAQHHSQKRVISVSFSPKFGFALNASHLRFMVIESWLTHIFLDALPAWTTGAL